MASRPKPSVAPELADRAYNDHTDSEDDENDDTFAGDAGDDFASAEGVTTAMPDMALLTPSQQKLVKTIRGALEAASAANPELFAREVRFTEVCRVVNEFAGFSKNKLAMLLNVKFAFRSPAEAIRLYCSDLVTLVGSNEPPPPPVDVSLVDAKIVEWLHTPLFTKQSRPIDVVRWLVQQTGISQGQLAQEYGGGNHKTLKSLVADKMKQHGGLVKRNAEQSMSCPSKKRRCR
eukprot:TRINITY_DN14215_c0_g3_i1.p1 TRINITY_DN14215_c0_g3~~TRINITY_DN14215_c0_g3_i1.p1  ORF type:complete len:250 (+),score=38.21 TRINITY_DN14215_c0_g3_i1:52-750(+)